jgi:hypothetical protein
MSTPTDTYIMAPPTQEDTTNKTPDIMAPPTQEDTTKTPDTTVRDTDVVLVLDKSGSMDRNREATISGANEAIDQERKRWESDTSDPKPSTFVSLITFSYSDQINILQTRISISEWKELTLEDYMPDGRTALNDAAKVAFEIEIPQGNRVLYIFITDGDSNADVVWRPSDVRRHIETFKTTHLDTAGEPLRKVLYVGCQEGARDAADSCGIDRTCSLQYDEERTPEAWSSVGRAITRTASGSKGPIITDEDRMSSSAGGCY